MLQATWSKYKTISSLLNNTEANVLSRLILVIIFTLSCLAVGYSKNYLTGTSYKLLFSKSDLDLYNKRKSFSDTTIQIRKNFLSQSGTLLAINSQLPIRITLVPSQTNQLQVLVELKGKGIKTEINESSGLSSKETSGQTSNITIRIQKDSIGSYITSSNIHIGIPKQVLTRLQLEEAQVNASKLEAPLSIQLTKGDVILSQISSNVQASVTRGSILCRQSTINGLLTVQSGLMQIEKTQGSFLLKGPCGQVSIDSPSQQVEGLLEKAKMTLSVVEADLQTTILQGTLLFTWKGNNTAGHSLSFQGTNSDLYLSFPERFSMDLNLDQNQSSTLLAALSKDSTNTSNSALKGKKMRLESELALMVPIEKQISFQGKPMKVAQSHQILQGGNNKVSIHTSDSAIYFKELPAEK